MSAEELEYNKLMSDGRWYESKGDSYYNQGYYSDAQNWYHRAKNCYDSAYDVASRTNNIATYDATSSSNRVDSAYRDCGYKLGEGWSLF